MVQRFDQPGDRREALEATIALCENSNDQAHGLYTDALVILDAPSCED